MMRCVTSALAILTTCCGLAGAQTTPDSPPAPPTPASLSDQIATLLAQPTAARDHWGIQVTTLDGTPLYSFNEGQLFQPASNTKLFTTAAAMALLGPDRRFGTQVLGLLDSATGRVTGDLVLKGGGDANFDSGDLPYVAPANRPKNVSHVPHKLRDIADLADQLVAKGVKRVDGDIVGDDTLFPWEPYPADWSIDDAVWGYGAPVSALTIADNELRLTMSAGTKWGEKGTAVLEQAVPYYTIQGNVETVTDKSQATGMQVVRMPGSHVLRIFGSMAVGAEADVEEMAIDDPAEYAAMALRAALLERGIEVRGVAKALHRPVNDAVGFLTELRNPVGPEEDVLRSDLQASACLMAPPPIRFPNGHTEFRPGPTVLASHISAPLSENVVLTNKVSQNLHAELLLHILGRRAECAKGSAVEGARLVRAFLIHAGIDGNDFVFYDGSGLSGHDLVTPRATAKLLAYAATNPQRSASDKPWFADWKESLPIGGQDGSLAGRFPKPPLKDHVFAKTGTLSEARALSGYLDAASGRTVIFSIMVGNHLPGDSSDRDVMDKIVGLIAAAE